MSKNVAYRYNAEQNDWTECSVSAWGTDNAENLPIVFVVDIKDERTGEEGIRAWCDTHRAYEKIAHSTDDGHITECGCTLKGLAIYVTGRIPPLRDKQEATLRWQIICNPKDGTVELAKDEALVAFDWIRNKETGEFVLSPFLHSTKHTRIRLCLRDDKQPQYLCHIPFPVAVTVLAALREEAAKIYGPASKAQFPLRPDLLPSNYWRQIDDASSCLLAFLHRPLDMRIWFFKSYFNGEKFDALFPRTQTDNFPALCSAFGLAPAADLKADYEKRGVEFLLRPMLYELLPKLGICKESLIEKFMGLSSFFGKSGINAYGQYLLPSDLRPEGAKEKPSGTWEDLLFYCDWRRQTQSEEELAAHLLHMQGSWCSYKNWTLQRFRQYFAQIPQSVKNELLRKYPTADISDEIAIIIRDVESNMPDRSYTEKERALECNIGGYNFRLLTSFAIRKQIFSYLSHVYAGTGAKFDDGIATMIGIEKNGVYLGIIAVKDSVATAQLLPYWIAADHISMAKIRIAYLRWILHNGLTDCYSHDEDCSQALSQDIPVEPVDRDEEWGCIGLREMLNIPESAIRPGYYLELFRRFMETGTLRPSLPTAEDDEREYLMKHLPWGKRIFDAAWAGTPEAQYVLSHFYHRFCHRFTTDDIRLSAAWYKKACENGWLEIEASKPDIRLDGVYCFANHERYRDRGGFFVG